MTSTELEITLTTGQQNALDAFFKFLIDPKEPVFVLSGYSGCGKSTLVRTILDRLPGYMKTLKLLNPDFKEYTIELTATTNKAAENLSRISGGHAITIHSFLGLRVYTDYRTNKTTLIPQKKIPINPNTLILIDEASYIDNELLWLIFKEAAGCKIVFIGDSAQLTAVMSPDAPVFNANFPGAELTEVVRQANGNPIVDLSTQLRNTVNSGQWNTFTPDGNHIQHLTADDFMTEIEKEFTRPDWKYLDSKVLAWTNKAVIGYNHYINNLVNGRTHFEVGDYAICNSFISKDRFTVKTDQLVEVTEIADESSLYGVTGNWITVDGKSSFFMPRSLAEKKEALKQFRAEGEIGKVTTIETSWIDLRPAFSQTVNKSQGSTYDKVFIDLDDVSRCNNGDQLARMLYVAVSRARTNVYLKGDIS